MEGQGASGQAEPGSAPGSTTLVQQLRQLCLLGASPSPPPLPHSPLPPLSLPSHLVSAYCVLSTVSRCSEPQVSLAEMGCWLHLDQPC